jgi:hypothetical protein
MFFNKELNSIYCRGTAIRMKMLPELLDCIISKCFLEGVEEVVADKRGEAAAAEVGDDGR